MTGKIKTHTINGKRFHIDLSGPLDGLCIDNKDLQDKDREILICADLSTQKGLITVIHEALHPYNITEERCDKISTDVGRLLWRLGYRKDL